MSLHYSGTVHDKTGALAVGRSVQIIRESNQTCVAAGVTDAAGEFDVTVTNNEAHTVIFSGETARNALGFIGVLPFDTEAV